MNFSLIGLAQVVGLIKYAEKCWFRPDMSWWEVVLPVLVIVFIDLLRFVISEQLEKKRKKDLLDAVTKASASVRDQARELTDRIRVQKP